MTSVTVLIFHRPAIGGEPELVRTLSNVRSELVERHSRMFARAGATDIQIVNEWHEGKSFGEVLAALAPARGGAIVLSGGAVPLLNARDAARLVQAAAANDRVGLTNNRYSSDVIAVARARELQRPAAAAQR